MRLKNKKTGEIIEFDAILPVKDVAGDSVAHLEYGSLAELNDEWEDYEEPKEFWYIGQDGVIFSDIDTITQDYADRLESIGNYFETKEEAEKAVEKLKAWKRLGEKGIELYGWRKNPTGTYDFLARWKDIPPKLTDIIKDLDLLFSQEGGNV